MSYADALGALTLPVAAPDKTDTPVGDPLREKLGAFLKGAIEEACGAAWFKIAKSNVVERVEVNDPSDNTFVTNKLPCLAVMRGPRNRKPQFLAEDIRYLESQVVVLWIPPTAVQHYRAARESFFQAIQAAVDTAVWRGRTSRWIDSGDTDPLAPTEGSLFDRRLQLLRPLAYGVDFADTNVEVEMAGAPTKKFPALQMTFTIWEPLELDFTKIDNAADVMFPVNNDTDTSTTQEQTYPLPS